MFIYMYDFFLVYLWPLHTSKTTQTQPLLLLFDRGCHTNNDVYILCLLALCPLIVVPAFEEE